LVGPTTINSTATTTLQW